MSRHSSSSKRISCLPASQRTTHGVPVKVLLLNNRGDGMIRQWQRLFYEGRMFVSDKSLHSKDFVMTAQADGFEFARRVQAVDELEGALRAFVEFNGPAFLEVVIDENADVLEVGFRNPGS